MRESPSDPVVHSSEHDDEHEAAVATLWRALVWAEVTLRENRAVYERITLLPRMLVDVSARDLGTTVLGEPVSMPILIAPTALHGLAHPEGEVATTKAPGAAKH